MKEVITIPNELYNTAKILPENMCGAYQDAVKNGTPLSTILDDLKRRILMAIDGGEDGTYLRYNDVCERVDKVFEEFKKEG